MAITALDGTGTTITFGSGFTANLIDVSGPSMERGAIDVTHMASIAAMEFLPATLYDGGSVDITLEFKGDDDPPIDSVAEELITIDWAGVLGAGSYSFQGFMTNYTPSATIGDRMTATASLKVAGGVDPIT